MNGTFPDMIEGYKLLQTVTVPFTGTCLSNDELTLVSKRLNFPYRTNKVVAAFALNTAHTLQLIPFISFDPSAPAAGRPSGQPLFSPYGQVEYLSGDDEHEEHVHQILVKRSGSYLKIYANNTDSFDHTVDAQIHITVIEKD